MSLSESLANTLQFSKPPSEKDTKSNPTATLAWMKTTISAIYLAMRTSSSQDKPPTVTRNAYVDLYSAVHDYCESTKMARESPNCEDLYRFLESEVKTYCTEVQARLRDSKADAQVDNARYTIEKYLNEWHRFTHLAGLVANLLRSLERTWIMRCIDEKRKDLYLIKDLHILVWKTDILQVGIDSTGADVGSKIARAVAMLQERIESGTESEKALTDGFSESLESIGGRPGDAQ